MRVFGRQISKWWLLPSGLIVCSPLLLPLFFAANNFAGAIVGPPAIWDVPFRHPSQDDLVGRYVESERHGYSEYAGPAVLELKSDGTMTVNDLPQDSGTNTCTLSGSGSWRAPGGQEVGLDFNSDGAPGICKSGWYASSLEVAGHSKSYKLYWVLGDPDSGTGIWLKRR